VNVGNLRRRAFTSTPGQSGVFAAPPRIASQATQKSGAALKDSLCPGVEERHMLGEARLIS
jgi:hypothetical protein